MIAKESFVKHGYKFEKGEEIPYNHPLYGAFLEKYKDKVVVEPAPKAQAKKVVVEQKAETPKAQTVKDEVESDSPLQNMEKATQ